jgi:hypothetical protein
MRLGILGLPQAGKSTLFEILVASAPPRAAGLDRRHAREPRARSCEPPAHERSGHEQPAGGGRQHADRGTPVESRRRRRSCRV